VKHRLAALLLAASAAGCFGTAASAASVFYSAYPQGGERWLYEYYVGNGGLAAVREVTVYFDMASYANLAVPATPPGWDTLVVEPDAGLPDDGFFDALALGDGIAPGGFAVFVVAFDYLGAGTPGPQRFDVVDPATFATLASGVTTAIPLPGTAWMLAAAFAAVASRLRPRVA
jgi:hypothetical protein